VSSETKKDEPKEELETEEAAEVVQPKKKVVTKMLDEETVA
jgi:hypothetical protein